MNQQQWQTSKEKLVVIDVVSIQVHEINSTLVSCFKDPHCVLEHEHGNKLEVRHLITYDVKVVHLDHVKRLSHSFGSSKGTLHPSA